MAKKKTDDNIVQDVKKDNPDFITVEFIKTFFDGKGKEFYKDDIKELPAEYAGFLIDNGKARMI